MPQKAWDKHWVSTASGKQEVIEETDLFLFYIAAQLTNNATLISGGQQSDSKMHIHVSIPFQILLPFRLLQNIE